MDAAAQPVAVVTGGARGIGLAIARWFLAAGQRVALLDIDRTGLKMAAASYSRKREQHARPRSSRK